MTTPTLLLALLVICAVALPSRGDEPAALAFDMETLDGEPVRLAEKYAGKVVLFVNVASKCGYTRQYTGLEALHDQFADRGLAIVGVPCNQFGGQEPGTAEEIAAFCSSTYGVEFDMLGKVDVKGDSKCPLYAHLTGASPFPGEVKWNFEKFLVSREGVVVNRYPSGTEPESPAVVADIERELAK